MKKLLIVLAAVAFIVGFSVLKAEAAPADEISVTVTLQFISVVVAPADWPLGIKAPISTTTQACTATNDGNVTENLNIAVSDSTNWNAGASAGADQFAMDFSLTGIAPWTNITNAPGVDLVNGLTATNSQNFTLQFTAPSSSLVTTQQSITVTVTATPA